jgi:hypothetical protein
MSSYRPDSYIEREKHNHCTRLWDPLTYKEYSCQLKTEILENIRKMASDLSEKIEERKR